MVRLLLHCSSQCPSALICSADYGHAGLRHETPKNQNPQPLRRSSRTSSSKTVRKVMSPLKNGNIKAYLSKKGDDPPPVMDTNPLKIQQPSSDEYKVDDGLFDDVEMQDAPDTAFSSNAPATALGPAPDFTTFAPDPDELLEEFYQTPPDSPSKIRNESSRTYAIQESLYPMRFSAQGSDSRCSSDTVVPYSRKRGLPASSKPDMPRKMSRDASERRSTGIGPAQPKGGLRYIGDPEFNQAILDRQKSFGSLQKSWSAESLSSVTSSAAIRPLSAWTTPNTSFLTETPATSFDSSQEPFELDYLRQKPVHARRSWQNLKAPFGLGLDMDMDVEVPEQAEVGLMGPPAPVLKYKSPPTVSVRNMLSASPFGENPQHD